MIFNPLPDKQQNVTLTLTGKEISSPGEITPDGEITIKLCAYIAIDGVKHSPPKTLTVPVGTTVSCHAESSFSGEGKIIVNGATTAHGVPAEYNYLAIRNATINFQISKDQYMVAVITITDT